MIWAQTILALILGLVVAGAFQNGHADKFFNLSAKNSTHGKPGNKTHHFSAVTPTIVDSVLYMKYACQGKQNGLRLPIEGSCTQYLECQQGSAKLMTCNAGKHFSTFGLACIDVKLSNCSVKCECCGKEDGLYPDVTNCANFVVCLKGKAHRQSCGSIFKFNSEKLMCDIPQRARCSEMSNNTFIEREIEAQSMKTPVYMISHKVCRNRSTGFTVGVSGSCNKFYLCINGKGYLKSCGHMQFNAEEHYCDARTRIYCPEFEENFIVLESDEIPKPWLRPEIPVPQIPSIHPDNIHELQPPHRVPGKPFPHEQLPNGNALHPPAVGHPEHPQHWGNNPGPIPHLPEGYEKPENFPYHPPNQGPHPTPPSVLVVDPVPLPPNVVVSDVEESIDPIEYSGLCADKSVGALIAMPRHCNKYIRCRWDWYERRIAEVESCPKDKHFNAISKLCDVPEKAGCVFHLKKKTILNE